MIVVYCCNFAPLNVRISRTNVVSLQENIYPWANPQYETWWNHPQFRETTTKFGKIWRSLAAKWQGSPTSTDHETGHIWCFQSYIWKIQGSTCASLLAVVFNCKHQNFIACKFSNLFFGTVMYRKCPENFPGFPKTRALFAQLMATSGPGSKGRMSI